MKATLFLPLLFIVQCCRSQPSLNLPTDASNQTLLWEITGKDLKKPSYLFGTFHMMCKDDIKFSNNLLKALKNSEEV